MRLEKSVDIQMDEKTIKTYHVYELKPLDVLDLQEASKLKKDDPGILDQVKKILPKASDISFEEFKKLYPSEQEVFFEAFKEVNRPFLRAVKVLDVLEVKGMILEIIKNFLQNEFNDSFADLLNPASIKDRGNTDSHFSLLQSKNTIG